MKEKLELSSNKLKVIAIICMIIDHVGYFYLNKIPLELYLLFRGIGRIAMPLFVFLLVEGYFHTKNLKKYFFRIIMGAIVTQCILITLNYINVNYFYTKIPPIKFLNILFSFAIILIMLRILDKNILKFKNNKEKIIDIFIRSIIVLTLIIIYFVVKIDYGIYLCFIAMCMYYFKKLENKIDKITSYIIQISVLMICSVLAIKNVIGILAALAYIFIYLYNNQKGKRSKILSGIFYLIYPIQYMIIYISALLIQ